MSTREAPKNPRNKVLRRPTQAVLATLAVIAALVAIAPNALAQTNTPDASQTSAALPFLGEFEVWCTDRNPAPFNLCSSHHGSPAIDIGMPIGERIYSTGAGEVAIADNVCSGSGWCNSGAGNYVAILHPDGTYSRYLHLNTVALSVGDRVVAGDLVGTNGVTGHSSSPHLHYDEQKPLGTRIDMGTFIGCVDGQQVEYPAAFGTNDWNDVPYGSIMINEDYSCHSSQAVAKVQTDAPRILGGPNAFAVAPVSSVGNAIFEISVDHEGIDEPLIKRVSTTAMVRFVGTVGTSQVRSRLILDGVAQLWSETVSYTPGDQSGGTCLGLYATQDSLTGTPFADVIIGTQAADTINGRGGNDILCGRGGNDTINGGYGRDIIYGQYGSDHIEGGTAIDIISGGLGQDTLKGQNGWDHLNGGSGTDYYDGGNGSDFCVDDSEANETTNSCERTNTGFDGGALLSTQDEEPQASSD